MRTSVLATLLGLSLVACAGNISGGGGDDDDVPETCGNGVVDPGEDCDGSAGCSATCTEEVVPRLDLSVDKPTVTTELGTSNMVTVTLTSSGGFSGPVNVAAALVDGASAPITQYITAVNPPTVTVPENGTATAVVTFGVPTEKAALTGTLKISTTGGPATGTLNLDAAVTVVDQVTIGLKINAGGQCDYPTAGTMRIKVGTKVRWLNDSNAGDGNIQIHITDPQPVQAAGFSHEGAPGIAPASAYEQTATATTNAFDWYCHAPGPTVGDRLIQVVP